MYTHVFQYTHTHLLNYFELLKLINLQIRNDMMYSGNSEFLFNRVAPSILEVMPMMQVLAALAAIATLILCAIELYRFVIEQIDAYKKKKG